jgi:hypothetical protein
LGPLNLTPRADRMSIFEPPQSVDGRLSFSQQVKQVSIGVIAALPRQLALT